jgi:hypothetical protein
MRQNDVTQTGVGTSSPIVLDHHGRPEISLQVVVTGTVTYTVQQTLDDPYTVSVPTWFDHPDANLVAQTVNRQGNYAYVPAMTRLNVTAGSGSARLTTIQAGIQG